MQERHMNLRAEWCFWIAKDCQKPPDAREEACDRSSLQPQNELTLPAPSSQTANL